MGSVAWACKSSLMTNLHAMGRTPQTPLLVSCGADQGCQVMGSPSWESASQLSVCPRCTDMRAYRNALQVATHLGVKRILACDKKQEALDLAVKLGVAAEDAICTGKPDCKPVHQVVAEREIILDTVIDFVGVEETLTNALLAVRSGGLLVMVGLLSPQVPLSPLLIVSRVLNIKGSFAGTVDGLRECLDLLSHGVIRPQIETASIEELPAVMDALDDSKYLGRKVLLPTWKQD